jgi:hypothetical protein
MPIVMVALLALLAASALALDAGLLWTSRTQLQGAVDAAALAAAANLIDPAGPAVTADAANAAAATVAGANRAVPTASVELAEVQLGHWDPAARHFDSSGDLSDPERVNAVDVRARLDGTRNRAVPAFFARVLGRDSFHVGAAATAWLGYAGSAPPGELDLPIAIDCCAIQGPACANDFCDTIGSGPPNPCPLRAEGEGNWQGSGLPQDDDSSDNPVSCLDLAGTTVQNACWTNFEAPGTANINTPALRELIDAGNVHAAEVQQVIELDNGDHTSVFNNLLDRFEADGSDRYEPYDLEKDSWVVRLPVVSCQQDTQPCSQGTIRGFVCFELRQIERNPGKMLRGRFLCRERDAELFEFCALGGSASGGANFSIQAAIPVLVR